jgi:ubiquinol-cytochrome c reductase iron-sulfur subunit
MSDHLPESTSGEHAQVATQEPIPDPGLPAHQWRPTDVDPRAEKRAERQVAGLFGLAIVGAVGFIASYVIFKVGDHPDTIGNLGASNEMHGL